MPDVQPTKRAHAHRVKADAKEPPLAGTMVAVLIVGAVVALTWFGVFVLFLARN